MKVPDFYFGNVFRHISAHFHVGVTRLQWADAFAPQTAKLWHDHGKMGRQSPGGPADWGMLL
ncbi:hypothetical protein ACEWPL_003490 [Roseovarius sp. S1116L3]|uniref:hypothetical protein n=1 Tax=Roseovarius roseus TaxID=3342636 RepID=UPI00372960C6